ncbi:MAG: NAD(P)-binding domain-containing protein [Sumerlaeia bacterium]
MEDCIIIGAGPTGLSIASSLQKRGINPIIIERGPIASNISEYPTFMRFFSTREMLELDDFPMTIVDEKPSRQQYLHYLNRFVQTKKLRIHTYTEVLSAEKQDSDVFKVLVRKRNGSNQSIETKAVVLACGAWEKSNELQCPGADLPKVIYKFKEVHQFYNSKVLVVGGRSGAIETSLNLFRSGVDVSLSYRRKSFDGRGVKYWLRPDIENRIEKDEIHGFLGTTVKRIDWESVTLADSTGEEITIQNDFVIGQIGYRPPIEFMEQMGIELDSETKIPAHHPDTLESTTVPGLFIAGVILAGNVSGQIFIENSRYHGEKIADELVRQIKPISALV